MIKQILSYKTLFFDIVTTFAYGLSPAMNKRLHTALIIICTTGGGPLFHSSYDGVIAKKMLPTEFIFHWPKQIGSQKPPNPGYMAGVV
jgi:hypothetical protein